MKLLEQYLYSISRQLPKDGKEEIIAELRSSLEDTIEDQYGQEPTNEELTQVLKSFGSPSSVAKEYGKSRYIISPAFTDLFILIMKIIVLGMLGSFTIAFVVEFATSGSNLNVGLGFATILGRTLTASISSFGTLTIVFMIISRVSNEREVPEEDWSPKDLEEIPSDKQRVKFGETLAGIIFSLIFLVAFNVYPEMINLPSEGLIMAGIDVHTINMDQFANYLLVFNLVWISTIIHAIILLVHMRYTKTLRLTELMITLASIALFYVMINDANLFIGVNNNLGPKAFFIFLAVVSVIESISLIVKFFIQD